MSDTILTDLQTDLAARLEADEYFGDITVVTELKADVLNRVEKALGPITAKGGKSGICVVMMSPVATCELVNLPSAIMEIEIAVRVLENVLINTGTNGTKKAALTVARRVARVLHHYRPGGLAQTVIADKPTIVPVDDPVAPLAYEVRFTSQESEIDTISKVATPTIGPNGGTVPVTVTLGCATAGAAIWYTDDGSALTPNNPLAHLYATPLNLTVAKELRVGAWKSGMIASDSAFALFE